MKIRIWAPLAVAVSFSIALSGCDLVSGDSLVVQAATNTVSPAGLAGESTVNNVTLKGVSGTAPCDYIPAVAADVNKYHPVKESLAFSGNSFTACMAHRSGAAIVSKYHDDLVTLTNYLVSHHVKVIYSAPLCHMNGSGWFNGDPSFRTMEQSLANFYRHYGNPVAYSDYAANKICPNGNYIRSNRGPDTFHLNSLGIGIYGPALRQESKQVNP